MIGRETWNGTRALHLHTSRAEARIDSWYRKHASAYEMKVTHTSDPVWEVLERWG